LKPAPVQKIVYIVGGDSLIERMYREHGYKITRVLEEATIVQFTGGSDVSPAMYGEAKHPTTGCIPARDEQEQSIYDRLPKSVMKVGICRGAQFLCVMNGGILWQDVDRHAISGTHDIIYNTGDNQLKEGRVTSTHHQMMRPRQGTNFKVLGWTLLSSYRDLGHEHREPTSMVDGPDNEIVWWPGTRSLGFQGHPEYGEKETEKVFFEVLEYSWDKFHGRPQYPVFAEQEAEQEDDGVEGEEMIFLVPDEEAEAEFEANQRGVRPPLDNDV
jgi:hypothetical protein